MDLGTSSYELFTLDWLTTQLRVLAKTLVRRRGGGGWAGGRMRESCEEE